MKFNQEKIAKLATLDEVEEEVYTAEEAQIVRSSALKRAETRRALAGQLSKVIANYMAKEEIGFNELQRRLGVSSATVSKLIKGESNVTLETVALVASLVGVTAEFKFEQSAHDSSVF